MFAVCYLVMYMRASERRHVQGTAKLIARPRA